MSHSHTSLIYHLVFATKYRRPQIVLGIRDALFAYMADVITGFGGHHIITNGPPDHAHQLCHLPPDITVAEAVQKVKSYSSGWVHRTFPDYRDFAWQVGYAAFTVGRDEIAAVKLYIERQLEHHKSQRFEEELARMHREHGLEIDPRHPFI
jgi:putative transposase